MNRLAITAASMIAITLTAHAYETAAPLALPQLLVAAQTAVDTCRAQGYAVTVTVLDPDLSTRLVLRGDGAAERTVEISRRKAYTVLKTGMSSGDFGKTVPTSALAADPSLITWAGGLPIRIHGVIVGAMSASGAPGGEKDEACVTAGLGKIAGAATP